MDPLPTRITPEKAEVTEEGGGEDGGPLPAKELGKGWRYFTTYADVQSSPVLRQQSLERT
jgi:hypothetical protein